MENNLNKILIELKKEMPFKWRVQSFSKHKPQATCVAYIDSRDVQDALDANCLWSDRYYEENGMLFCEITIYADGREYKRSDTGSESQADAQKGHSSDAFKRAAVKFGVGRFLYNQKIQYVQANEIKTKTNYPYVIDSKGKRIWDLTKHINNGLGKTIPLETLQSKPINIDNLKTKLTNCSTLQELKDTYSSFTKKEKEITVTIKDQMKATLTKKTA